MFPYLAMLAVPSSLALTGARRAGFLLILVGLIYWLMIGFRFQVGMDWNNYISIYEWKKNDSLVHLLTDREPAYGFLMWTAARTGWGFIFVNAVSSLVFCWGFFATARRCREPWLAIAIATPLLVIAFAMSGARQSIACGVIFYLFSSWENRSTLGRISLVLFAMLFHFSAVFVLAFVASASRAPSVIKAGSALVIAAIIVAIIRFAPGSMDTYSRLYIGVQSKLSAPGAIIEVGVLAIAGMLYSFERQRWSEALGDNPLIRNLALGAIACLPLILVSSVGAYRFALYLWPMAMYVYSAIPSLVWTPVGRAFYRLVVINASFGMLIGWLLFANNSLPWMPYRNWLLQPDGVSLISHKPFKQ